jgi:magnesium chelatase accessory protein
MRRLDLDADGADWPNRQSSRMVQAGGFSWHVQIMGAGPTLLLLHGVGAATHSWRDLAPLLAGRFRVVAPDLPGHGFSSSRGAGTQSLAGMARAVADLLAVLDLPPAIVVGHSAGAAVLARLVLDKAIAPAALISLNGALAPFEGVAGYLLPTLAKVLFLNPLAPRYFASVATPAAVTRLLHGTGSKIDARGVALYSRLMRDAAHIDGALGMMAQWDLRALDRELPKLRVPLHLVVTGNDKTVPPEGANKTAARVANAQLLFLPELGHLAHEEAPARFAELIFNIAQNACR